MSKTFCQVKLKDISYKLFYLEDRYFPPPWYIHYSTPSNGLLIYINLYMIANICAITERAKRSQQNKNNHSSLTHGACGLLKEENTHLILVHIKLKFTYKSSNVGTRGIQHPAATCVFILSELTVKKSKENRGDWLPGITKANRLAGSQQHKLKDYSFIVKSGRTTAPYKLYKHTHTHIRRVRRNI